MSLFDDIPTLEGRHIILREMRIKDAQALYALSHNDEVYRYLPTFLYEQRYDDAETVIARMHTECFDVHESLL